MFTQGYSIQIFLFQISSFQMYELKHMQILCGRHLQTLFKYLPLFDVV